MSTREMGRLGQTFAFQLFSELSGRPGIEQDWHAPLDFRDFLLPKYGLCDVEVKTFGGYRLEPWSERVGLVSGMPREDFVEYQREQRPGRDLVLAFVDYIVQEIYWASIREFADPRQFRGFDGRGSTRMYVVPIEAKHPISGELQYLWPVDLFAENRRAISRDRVKAMWRQRTHAGGAGRRRDGREVEDFEFQRKWREQMREAEGQKELLL